MKYGKNSVPIWGSAECLLLRFPCPSHICQVFGELIFVSEPPSASESWTIRNSLPFPRLTDSRVPSEASLCLGA